MTCAGLADGHHPHQQVTARFDGSLGSVKPGSELLANGDVEVVNGRKSLQTW